MDTLKKAFEKAGLDICIENVPFQRGLGQKDIFQMTISNRGKTKNYKEFFRLYKGHDDNNAEVISIDPDYRQLVLLVHEAARRFIRRSYDFKQKKYVDIEEITKDTVRKYLMGMDERHLFISELPAKGLCTPVSKARELLKTESVKQVESSKGKVKRQGEWFFVTLKPEELKIIEDNKHLILKKEGISSGGKPHVADEVLRIEHKVYVRGKLTRTEQIVYARGAIRHKDHKTLYIQDWHRVLLNAEIRSNSTGRFGGWVD